ncbi:sensor histidine kinase [Rhodocista pekingensis]|uniref:histidine kinase n=1 Tax=Rhodocista pekingensis TaxID=201185 RepID=A0ABW2L241_9PROT
MDDFRQALYEGVLVAFGKAMARFDGFAQGEVMRDVGRELIEYLNRKGLCFKETGSVSDLEALIRLFVDNGFAESVEIVPADRGSTYVWRNLYGAPAYAELHRFSDNPFLACPLNLCLYDLAERRGVRMLLHRKAFGPGCHVVESQYEIVPKPPEAEERDQLVVRSATLVEQARQREAERSRFLAHASHDLRQPVQAVSIFTELLVQRLAGTEHQGTVDKLQQAVAATQNLLNALLDAAVLDSGQVQPHVSAFPLGPLLASLADQVREEAAAKRLRLRIVPTSAWVVSDPVLLERLLRNLLLNALRFTSSGGMLLGCRPRGRQLALCVVDSGIGIPADKLKAVFEDFTRLGEGDGSSRGFGLGLGVVRRMAGVLNHGIEVRSTPGRGSTFAVLVPRAAPGGAASGISPAPSDGPHASADGPP